MIRVGPPGVIVFSIIAGTLLGLGDVSTKVLLVVLQRHVFGFQAAAAGAGLIVCYLSGFLVLSRAYQHGRAILVTAVSDLCSRLVSIFIGFMALGESLAGDPRLRVCAVLGYVGILGGVIFLSRFSGEEIADGIKSAQASRSHAGVQADGQPQERERTAPAQIDADD